MKTLAILLLFIPCANAQWKQIPVTKDNFEYSVNENFRRAAIYSNRKLDKYGNESATIYSVTVSSTVCFSDGSCMSATASGTIDALPIGTFIQYGSTTPPTSYLYCDGTNYSTTTYSALFAIIGYNFGGSGANFTCDFRGMFARGLDTTGTIDSEARVIGSSETDKFQGHWHTTWNSGSIVTPAGAYRADLNGYDVTETDYANRARNPSTDGTNGTPRTGNETRPKNIAVTVMVKYQNPVINYDGLSSSNTFSGINTFINDSVLSGGITGNTNFETTTATTTFSGWVDIGYEVIVGTVASSTIVDATCSTGKKLIGCWGSGSYSGTNNFYGCYSSNVTPGIHTDFNYCRCDAQTATSMYINIACVRIK